MLPLKVMGCQAFVTAKVRVRIVASELMLRSRVKVSAFVPLKLSVVLAAVERLPRGFTIVRGPPTASMVPPRFVSPAPKVNAPVPSGPLRMAGLFAGPLK